MISTQLRNIIKFVFLPALLLSIFLSGSSILFQLSKNALAEKQLVFTQIPTLKIFLQITLTLSFLFFSIYKPFEKVFKGALIALIGIISLLTALTYKAFLPASLMYIVLSLLNFNLYSLFIWGFINRLVSPTEGIKYYIPLAFILGVAGAVISNLGLMLIGAVKWPLMAMIIPAIALMVGSFFTFTWAWKRLPDSLIQTKEEFSVLQGRFPFLSAAYLLAGCVMAKNFLDILFKSQLNTQLPDPASYSKLMGYYSLSIGSSTLVISIIWALLGTWLILRKGWKTTALYASLSILIGGIIFLNLPSSWVNQGIFTGLLMSTTSALFFPLIQILYLYMPYQNRFRTKIITEMVALPLMKGIPSLVMQGLLLIFGSLAATALSLKILVLTLMVLLIVASQKVDSQLLGTKTKS